jgi:signal transduction histidine kinase
MNTDPIQILDGMPALILALDADGNIAFWNRRLESVSGFPRGEMLGRPGRGLIEGAGACPLPVRSGGQRLIRWDTALLAPGGEPRAEGTWSYAVGTDVTDEQELQAHTRRADRLAATVTLAAGLAHEVRNPLNAALLQLTVLRRRLERPDCTPEALRPIAAVVEQEIQRLERLVNDFIAFAHPRPLDLRLTDLGSLCATIAKAIEPDAADARVRIALELPGEAPVVRADPERLQQMLLNLARNALEAMPGGGELTLRLRRTDAAVEIDVADTGPGFPASTPVFDAFFTTKPHGTGLGLSIVHRIATDHGGTVAVRSRPGETCFTVGLPPAIG